MNSMLAGAGAVLTLALTLAALPSRALARDTISVVGSSTIYPFATVVAERFGRGGGYPTPKIEATGSGGGFKLFCRGVGPATPDITDASRRMLPSEFEQCRRHGVGAITEVVIGYDGIVVANSARARPFNLSLKDLYLALARHVPAANGHGFVENPYKTWRQVDPALPDRAIQVLGPPPTSGTRDAFDALAMQGGCERVPRVRALQASDPNRFRTLCRALREDGAFIEAGENDNLIVQKLEANPEALGVFGFSYLDQNRGRLQGARINGVAPGFKTIADGAYPISRPLYMYIKDAHVGVVPGIPGYLHEFTSERAWGPDGYLANKGLIPLPQPRRGQMARRARDLTPLNGALL